MIALRLKPLSFAYFVHHSQHCVHVHPLQEQLSGCWAFSGAPKPFLLKIDCLRYFITIMGCWLPQEWFEMRMRKERSKCVWTLRTERTELLESGSPGFGSQLSERLRASLFYLSGYWLLSSKMDMIIEHRTAQIEIECSASIRHSVKFCFLSSLPLSSQSHTTGDSNKQLIKLIMLCPILQRITKIFGHLQS